ncbi:MAG: redoxin domain-containing protein [Pseudomonadota bacterium]
MPTPLPDWTVSEWFNTPAPISLRDLRGKVVVVEAFQMLCPGCVTHGLPLATKIYETFHPDDIAVIGLHTVFEHHAAMTPVSLKAFLHEYRIRFPVGVDTPSDALRPQTMAAYELEGTPSLLLIDREGHLAARYLGHVNELKIGAQIATLAASG